MWLKKTKRKAAAGALEQRWNIEFFLEFFLQGSRAAGREGRQRVGRAGAMGARAEV